MGEIHASGILAVGIMLGIGAASLVFLPLLLAEKWKTRSLTTKSRTSGVLNTDYHEGRRARAA